MGNTYKQQARKFDDEQYSGRSGKHAKHTNNHKFNGIPVIEAYETTETEDDFALEVDSLGRFDPYDTFLDDPNQV